MIREIVSAILAAVISVAGAIIALRISPTDMMQRWQISSPDGVLHYLLFVNSTQTFSYTTNPNLGFPSGLDAFFVAQVDMQSALAMSVLAAIVHNGILSHNLYVLGTFALVALGGYAFFRALRIRRWLSVLFAVIFSLAPYHFLRVWYGHTFIENYWIVPLAGILVLIAAGPRTNPFTAWAARASSRRGRIVRTALPPVILSLVVATGEPYYFVFAVLIVGGVWLFGACGALITRTPWRTIAATAIVPVSLVFFVGINLLVMAQNYGVRYQSYAGARLISDSEIYSGKLMSLLLPWLGSGFPGASRLANHYASASNVLPYTEATGTPMIASVGMIALVLVVLIGILVGNRTLADTWVNRIVTDPRTRVLAVALLWAFLFFVVSGLGVAVAMVAGTQVRAWVRVCIFLTLFGLAFVAMVVNALPSKYGIRIGVAGLLAVVAVFDQVVGVAAAVPLKPTADDNIKAYVAAADNALPNGCGVVQLPMAGFPETPPTDSMPEHELALPFLYTTPGDIRWSYGSVDGTVGRKLWTDANTPDLFGTTVKSTGACAISVNLDGYSDHVDAWKPFVAAAGGNPDAPTVTSPDGGILLFTVGGATSNG
ncbi:hypothetical protein [Subtercola endophyticus]|uniref:hypothetical protein n=1 Tax=Subtercola endophyticus TaxID=2895559 RepID=UPI001E5460E8|nr:hypothetical protein [Subtercola endophyticus]UFS57677.1 hypothetical protein LQ955_11505 [Subtercola endophyticus]